MGNHRFEILHLLAQRTSEKEKAKTENKTNRTEQNRTELNSHGQLEKLSLLTVKFPIGTKA